jgi:acyl carrier protein
MAQIATDRDVHMWILESGVELEIVEADYQTPLVDLGVDSLDFYGILEFVENVSGVRISDEAAPNLRSIADIGSFIRSEAPTT